MSGKAKIKREKLNECLQQMQINMSIDDISNDINLQFVQSKLNDNKKENL